MRSVCLSLPLGQQVSKGKEGRFSSYKCCWTLLYPIHTHHVPVPPALPLSQGQSSWPSLASDKPSTRLPHAFCKISGNFHSMVTQAQILHAQYGETMDNTTADSLPWICNAHQLFPFSKISSFCFKQVPSSNKL